MQLDDEIVGHFTRLLVQRAGGSLKTMAGGEGAYDFIVELPRN